MNRAKQEDDWSTIADLVHKLKGGAVYCGAPRFQQACISLETCLREGAIEFNQQLYAQLLAEMEALKHAWHELI